MSFFQSSSSFESKLVSVDEKQWIAEVRQMVEQEPEDTSVVPVSIFNVPKGLMACDQDSYIPREVGIGPYHNQRQEVYGMQRYKIAAARRIQHLLPSRHKFDDLVDQLKKQEPRIRDCYHKYIEFSDEMLAWMMVIDASFLLEFLQVYVNREGKLSSRISSSISHVGDYAGKKSAHNAILRDIVMLENQIPLLVLRKILEYQFSSLEEAEARMLTMLVGFCKELYPFKMMEKDLPKIRVSELAHLLDFLYEMITPKKERERQEDIIEAMEESSQAAEATKEQERKEASFGDSNSVKNLLKTIWMMVSKLNVSLRPFLKNILSSRPVQVILKLPWNIISNIPGLRFLKTVEPLCSSQDKEGDEQEDDDKPPLVEEITIPSVTELSNCGVRFVRTNGNLSTIHFDVTKVIFYLPTISLDVNSETVMRNLVAYEASKASGPLVFTRYAELMNGIIDTEEDVKLLRERGIILNRLKSDEEVANLWNGMSKSIRLTKVPFLDKVIEDVNKYYNGKWNVKVGNYIKLYVFGSWQILTFLAAVLMLLLMGLQAFCSVYTCGPVLKEIENGDL